MSRVEVSYGPPGAVGVTTILGIGAADLEANPLDSTLEKAAWGGVALWAIGVVLRKRQLAGFGLGVAACGWGVKYLGAKALDKAVAEAAQVAKNPTAGW